MGCPFNFRPPRIVAGWFFYLCRWDPLAYEGVRAVCSKTCSLTPLRKCNVGRGATGVTGAKRSQQCWL